MSYGSVAGVAALSPMWTRDGSFYDDGASETATDPSLSQVTTWLEEVSSMLDTAMADAGFVVPVTEAAVLPQFNLLVNGIVKDIVDYSRKSGRFFIKKALDSGLSPFAAIDQELHDWVIRKTVGLEGQGVLKDDDVIGRNVATFDLL